MQVSPILSPSGEPVFTAGGKAAWKVVTYRGWVVSFEWVRRRRKHLALMVIWPATSVLARPDAVKAGQWAISRNVLADFVGFTADGKCTGSASPALVREALEALEVLGKDRNDKHALLSLVDTVIRFAPDLALMPAVPKAVKKELDTKPMWDVTATNKNTGKTLSEVSI